jgi:hypothetical protein
MLPFHPQLVNIKKTGTVLQRSMTTTEYKPVDTAPTPSEQRAVSDSTLYKDTNYTADSERPTRPTKRPKDLPKLRSPTPTPRLPSINEAALEPFRGIFLSSQPVSAGTDDSTSRFSPTSPESSQVSRSSVSTVATSHYDDDGEEDEKREKSVELPLQFHPHMELGKRDSEEADESFIVCGLPCSDAHRAHELQYTLDVLTGSRARRIDEEGLALESKLMKKKNTGAATQNAKDQKQPVKPSGLVAKFAGAKERKKMERELLKRFNSAKKGKEGVAAQEQKPRRRIL